MRELGKTDPAFGSRHRRAEARVARLNREEMAPSERTLEGPGSEERLRRLRARFRATGVGRVGWLPQRATPARRGRLGMALWLTLWATCVGLAAALILTL